MEAGASVPDSSVIVYKWYGNILFNNDKSLKFVSF